MTNIRSGHYTVSYLHLIYFVFINIKAIAFSRSLLQPLFFYHTLLSSLSKFHCILSPLVCTCSIFVVSSVPPLFFSFSSGQHPPSNDSCSSSFLLRWLSRLFSRPKPPNRTGGCWTPRSGLRSGSPASRGCRTTPRGTLGSRSTRPARGPSERRSTTRWPTSKGCCCCCCCRCRCSCRRERGGMITFRELIQEGNGSGSSGTSAFRFE